MTEQDAEKPIVIRTIAREAAEATVHTTVAVLENEDEIVNKVAQRVMALLAVHIAKLFQPGPPASP